MKMSVFKFARLAALAVGASLPLALTQNLSATENVPHAPFAEWADLPAPGQLIAGFLYDESESYHIWANGGQRYNVDNLNNGEHYGIDVNQGYFAFQYGIAEKWAADLNVGATTVGWRTFSNGGTPGTIQKMTGLMDIAFGVRYQIFNENDTNLPPWTPTLTFRAGEECQRRCPRRQIRIVLVKNLVTHTKRNIHQARRFPDCPRRAAV